MEFFRFIGWWWNKKISSEKFFILFFGWALLTIPSTFFGAGIWGLFAFLGGIVLFLILMVLYQLWKSAREQWETYKVEKEVEAQEIIDRLSGITHTRSKADDILDQIRKRRGGPARQ